MNSVTSSWCLKQRNVGVVIGSWCLKQSNVDVVTGSWCLKQRRSASTDQCRIGEVVMFKSIRKQATLADALRVHAAICKWVQEVTFCTATVEGPEGERFIAINVAAAACIANISPGATGGCFTGARLQLAVFMHRAEAPVRQGPLPCTSRASQAETR
jgi:hypothetical protein